MVNRGPIFAAICLAALAAAGSAAASCIPMTAAQQRAGADVIVDVIALGGPTATGIERFHVLRYRKGRGRLLVRVRTGRKLNPDGTGMTTSVSIEARRGQKWRLFLRRIRPGLFETNVCLGSRRLR